MSMFAFLKTAQVEEVIEEKKKAGGVAKQWNPNPATLAVRVWKDGRVYPSQAAVDKFNLEYQGGTYKTKEISPASKDETTGVDIAPVMKREFIASETPGNGFDVIDSRMWTGFKAESHMLFLGVVPKTEGKVDLFATTRYDENGKPLSGVMDQGAATFGKEVLLPALKELYGIELNEEREFVDMVIAGELEGINITEMFSKPIMYAPKRVVRGKDAGKPDYIRRENMPLYAFIPESVATPVTTGTVPEPEA